MSKCCTAADILGADDRRSKRVEVPEWGGHVYVRSLSGLEKELFSQAVNVVRNGKSEVNDVGLRARYLAVAICDEQKQPLFTLDQVEALGTRNTLVLDRVWKAALELNAETDDGREELVKNSKPDQNADSISG